MDNGVSLEEDQKTFAETPGENEEPQVTSEENTQISIMTVFFFSIKKLKFKFQSQSTLFNKKLHCLIQTKVKP